MNWTILFCFVLSSYFCELQVVVLPLHPEQQAVRDIVINTVIALKAVLHVGQAVA